MRASPVGQPPRARQASGSSGPAARCTAPSTPPPPRNALFAAVTIASTERAAMSARIARSGIGSDDESDGAGEFQHRRIIVAGRGIVEGQARRLLHAMRGVEDGEGV